MLDDKFVYVNIVCFCVSCLQLEYGTFVPRVRLRKCTLKTPLLLLSLSLFCPHHYHKDKELGAALVTYIYYFSPV